MPANNDSSCVQTYPDICGLIKQVIFDVIFDSGDGSFADAELEHRIEGKLLMIETNPGGTAPTEGYDVFINDAEGADVLHTLGNNRSTDTTVRTQIHANNLHPVVSLNDVLTLSISGQDVNSAITKIILYYGMHG